MKTVFWCMNNFARDSQLILADNTVIPIENGDRQKMIYTLAQMLSTMPNVDTVYTDRPVACLEPDLNECLIKNFNNHNYIKVFQYEKGE